MTVQRRWCTQESRRHAGKRPPAPGCGIEGRPLRQLDVLTEDLAYLGNACIGQISEVFDAEPPFMPRGCVAQAWVVAETLRVLLHLAESPA